MEKAYIVAAIILAVLLVLMNQTKTEEKYTKPSCGCGS